MTDRYETKFIPLLAGTTLWCVAMPFFWAYNLHKQLDPASTTYGQVLALYTPELVTGAIFLLCLPLVILRPRTAAAGLACAALLLPALVYRVGTPGNVWPVTTVLLLLLSWRVHARFVRQRRNT
ncbi:MAG TPA: hypothetical protein VKC56_07440 [Gallionellaceae bacterium]|nr:hypothetical protein [Gallionellaceae bacterium]